MTKTTGVPIHPSLHHPINWPYTVAYAVALRQQYDSYQELPEPVPEEHWDHPHLVRAHIQKLYPSPKKEAGEFSIDEVEL